jgi:hypothetical protein
VLRELVEAGVGPGSEFAVDAADAASVAVAVAGSTRAIARDAAAAIWVTA